MNKLNLQEFRELFEKFSIESLDSLSILISNEDSFIKSVYVNVYNKKFEKIKDEYEGINEYDYICKILNFNIKEIKNDTNILKKEELVYLYNLINKVIKDILIKTENDAYVLENSILSILLEYKDIISNKLSNELDYFDLEVFFNKLNIFELNALSNIFEYIKVYDKDCLYAVFSKVRENKENNLYNEYIVDIKPYNFSLLNIIDNTERFSDIELNFLYKLVTDASFYLSIIQEYDYFLGNSIEDFDISEYPIITINKLEVLLKDEILKRKELKAVKVYKKNS